jgi:hypothetical protein
MPENCEIEFMAYVGLSFPRLKDVSVTQQPLKINEELVCLYCHYEQDQIKTICNYNYIRRQNDQMNTQRER